MNHTIRRALMIGVGATFALGACSSTATTSTGGTTAGTTAGTSAGSGSTSSVAKSSMPPITSASPTDIIVIDTPFGKALGKGDGKVLYSWATETGSTAECVDPACLEKWPPFIVTSISVGAGLDASMFTLSPRPDGTRQVTVNGKRLYGMMADAPGEANCQGGEGWYIHNVDGSVNTNTTAIKK